MAGKVLFGLWTLAWNLLSLYRNSPIQSMQRGWERLKHCQSRPNFWWINKLLTSSPLSLCKVYFFQGLYGVQIVMNLNREGNRGMLTSMCHWCPNFSLLQSLETLKLSHFLPVKISCIRHLWSVSGQIWNKRKRQPDLWSKKMRNRCNSY